MKAFTKLFLIFFFSAFSNFTISAQGTITWALTTNGNAVTSSGLGLTASPVSVGSGLTLPTSPSPYSSSGIYQGVTAQGWSSSATVVDLTEYYEYKVTTPPNATWVVSSIKFTHRDDGGSWKYSVRYSKDNFVTSTVFYPLASPDSAVSSTTIYRVGNIPMPINTTLSFRVYAYNSNVKLYTNLNFVITGTTAAALPVTLSSFTAKQTTDNKVSLAWVTSSESVNKGFSIERQEDVNGKFQSLGFIPSKAEGGNSQTTLSYNFKDVTAKMGTNIYRLVQEDLDGKKSNSEVRMVKFSAQSVSNVFPNPSTGDINISRSNDGRKMNIQVLDQSGRVISQVNNIIDNNYKINLLKSGIYNIKMTYPETGEQSIQRIVVQK